MKIEIRVTYPATDGSMPEDVSVEMEFDGPTLGPMAMEQAVLPILDRLLHAPGTVRAVVNRTESAMFRDDPGRCGHPACGHHQGDHKSTNQVGAFVGTGKGVCLVCGNADICNGFIQYLETVK